MVEAHDPVVSIIERVRPPLQTVNGDGDWGDAERWAGTRLPDDYKQLVQTYGRGTFCLDVDLCTPFGADNPIRLQTELLEDYGPLRESSPESFPYPLYPEPGGLIAWATTSISTHICWLTEGPPESWPVVIWSRDDDYERYDCGAAAFLDGWLSGRITTELLYKDPDLPPWFDAAIERDHIDVRVDEGHLPYSQRLRILREALAPTADRGSSEHDGRRQDHFIVSDTGWLLTYETAYGHRIRVAFPPADSADARQAILAAVDSMGCTIRSVDTVHGTSSGDDSAPGVGDEPD